MAFQIVIHDDDDKVEVQQRLCLTEDGRLVDENDPAARWLYCVPGARIPRDEAAKYGLLVEEKAASQPADKAVPALANKGRRKA